MCAPRPSGGSEVAGAISSTVSIFPECQSIGKILLNTAHSRSVPFNTSFPQTTLLYVALDVS